MLYISKEFHPLWVDNKYSLLPAKDNKILCINKDPLNPFLKDKLFAISKYKLADLQEFAELLGICKVKLVNGNVRKRTKKELYDDIKIHYENEN